MILADKIINERKKNGWSQEELAEQLSVSRQSVSKWESAQSTPDLQKIIQMSQIFGVSTDYLLKDEVEEITGDIVETTTNYSDPIRSISLAEANEYLEDVKTTAPKIAVATSLCICSPIVLLFMSGLLEAAIITSEALCAGVGLLCLFAMISTAVAIFIKTGSKLNKYDYMQKESFETQYGITGMVKELLKESESFHQTSTIAGVALCICCAVPLIISALLDAPDHVYIFMVCVLLIMVSAAVTLFILSGTVHNSYQILLQEGEFNKKKKKANKKLDIVGSIYWPIVTAIFLGSGFIYNNWSVNWIIWPVAGVLYGAVCAIVKAVFELKETN